MVRARIFIGVDQAGDRQKLSDAATGAKKMHEWALGQGLADKTHAPTLDGRRRNGPSSLCFTLPVMAERMRAGRIGASWGFRPTPSSRQPVRNRSPVEIDEVFASCPVPL